MGREIRHHIDEFIGLLRRVVNQPTLVSVPRESIWSALEVEIPNTVAYVSIPATSPGDLKASPEKSV